MRGTLVLSWGPYGGFYWHRRSRVCLGWFAITYVPDVEVEDLMLAYVEKWEAVEGTTEGGER